MSEVEINNNSARREKFLWAGTIAFTVCTLLLLYFFFVYANGVPGPKKWRSFSDPQMLVMVAPLLFLVGVSSIISYFKSNKGIVTIGACVVLLLSLIITLSAAVGKSTMLLFDFSVLVLTLPCVVLAFMAKSQG